MRAMKPVGRDAATKKYDILTALSAFALSQDKHKQRQVLRLMSLITARYNWQRDELTMGQAEIARMWSVDLRTVKREMAKLRALGWLVQKSAAARGRVAVHGLSVETILRDTSVCWALVGSDLVDRLSPPATVPAANVVPFRTGDTPQFASDFWGKVGAAYFRSDAAGYHAWISTLALVEREGGIVTLAAPSRFHATYVERHLAPQLLRCAQSVDPSVLQVAVCS